MKLPVFQRAQRDTLLSSSSHIWLSSEAKILELPWVGTLPCPRPQQTDAAEVALLPKALPRRGSWIQWFLDSPVSCLASTVGGVGE